MSRISASHQHVHVPLQVEKARQALNNELEELSERLDEAGGATAAQVRWNDTTFFQADYLNLLPL